MTDLSFVAISPEIALTAGALAVLGVDLIWNPPTRLLAWVAGMGVVAAVAAAVWQWVDAGTAQSLHYSGMVSLDRFEALAGIVMVVVAGLGLTVAWPLLEGMSRRRSEFVVLVFLSAAGFHLMAAAADLMIVFLGLEVGSISLYVLAGFTRLRPDADEASLKYFLLGGFASAVFLYGVALFYAAVGTTSLAGAVDYLRSTIILSPGILLTSIALMLVGLGFKVSAAPFHMWAPDVYQGAPGGIVGFMAAAAKIGGFAALARVLVGPLAGFINDWAPPVALLAAASIVVGTLLAVVQTDLKRMLAYSSVAHAGYMLTALVAGRDGVDAMWFYLATYVLQIVGAFAVAAIVSGEGGGRTPLSTLAGMSTRSPVAAAGMGTMMLAMAGIPLTAGFIGKVAVFRAAIDVGYLWLVILGLVAAVAGLFFYLRVVVIMFMQPAPADAVRAPNPTRIVLWAAAAATIVIGIVPWPLLEAVGDVVPL